VPQLWPGPAAAIASGQLVPAAELTAEESVEALRQRSDGGCQAGDLGRSLDLQAAATRSSSERPTWSWTFSAAVRSYSTKSWNSVATERRSQVWSTVHRSAVPTHGPARGPYRPAAIFAKVDLPEPFSPRARSLVHAPRRDPRPAGRQDRRPGSGTGSPQLQALRERPGLRRRRPRERCSLQEILKVGEEG